MGETYSIWLVPERGSREYEELRSIIQNHSEKYSNTAFEPHVTVIGGLEADRETVKHKTEEIARKNQPVDIEFKSAHCSTTRYQCVFLLLKPTQEILEINQEAVKKFEGENYMYIPHLSILYGNIGISERVDLTRSLRQNGFPDKVTANALEIVESSGSVEDWEKVESYRL